MYIQQEPHLTSAHVSYTVLYHFKVGFHGRRSRSRLLTEVFGGLFGKSASASASAGTGVEEVEVEHKHRKLFGSVGQCVEDRFAAKIGGSGVVCTANDVSLSSYTRISGPTSCLPGEQISVVLKGQFGGTASERYDIGIFVATDGGNALAPGGVCYNDFLHYASTNNNLTLIWLVVPGLSTMLNIQATPQTLRTLAGILQIQQHF